MSETHKIHDALTAANLEYAARSWGGFNLFGDSKSIAELCRLMSEAAKVKELQRRLQQCEAAKQPSESSQ